jgi:hypothetical protein
MRKTLLVFLGYCVGLGGLVLITYRTLLAVGSESKAIMVQVNRFGEQYLDLVCLVFLWVVCLVGLLSLSSMVKEGKREPRFHTESVSEVVGKKQTTSFVVSDSFLDSPSMEETGVSGVVFQKTNQGDFFLYTDGHEGVFSVSVIIQQEGCQE